MENEVPLLSDLLKNCLCCEKAVGKTAHREPLCDVCVAPGEARTYCAKCGARGAYPLEDFLQVMAKHYPAIELGSGTVVRLPACLACRDDGKNPVGDGLVRFYGISFD